MKNRLGIIILTTGFSGLVAQMLLLRELLIVFLGNELSIGIIFANWLILEAFGCFFLGKRAEHIKNKVETFVGIILLFSLSLPTAIYLTRILKEIIGVTPGEGLDLLSVLYSSFIILLPVSLSHGALFTFGCKIYSLSLSRTFLSGSISITNPDRCQDETISAKRGAGSIGKVYVYETLGTIVGGIAFTYLLIPYFHSFQIAIGVSLLNFLLCLFLIVPLIRGKAQKIMGAIVVIFLLLSGYLILGGADKLHRFSIKGQWKDHKVVHYENSIYGNICVIHSDEQYTFFSDGIPIITTPTPDITFVEEFVHLPMLAHPGPEKVLILSGGAGGVIGEVLKHPSVERVEYAELDPLILKVIKRFPTPLTEAELSDPRVKIKYMDGRLFVKRTPHKYDLILVGLSNPSDLQVNRLFTKEFFSLVKNRLKEEGILVISLPGSLTYLSRELKNLNACILNTLKSIYPYVRIIPGDGTNLYLSSISESVSLIEEAQLSQRLRERNLNVRLLTPGHIEYKLHPRWRDWFLRSLEGGTEEINQDFQPLGVFFSISYWNALFSPYMRRLFRWFEKINLRLFFILLVFFTLIFLVIRAKIKRLFRISIPLCIITTGFAGMIFDLALIFTFQALYGYVFHWLGLLVTALMIGVAVGGMTMTSLLARIKRDISSFIKIELAIVFFSGILPVIFLFFHPYLARPVVFVLLQVVFLVLSFLSGLLVGAQFPLANKIYLGSSPDLCRTAGLLYGADLFGGWIGGIVGGVILLPVLGLLGTCMVVVMLKVSSLIIVATSVRRLV